MLHTHIVTSTAGKGRQLAGIIMENFLCGRKKHVWLSLSADLRLDARRDLDDIGAGHIKTVSLGDFDYSPIRLASGVMFATYSSLIAKKASKGHNTKTKTRLEQLLAWCGKDFDGCLLFDECHKAKNLGMNTINSSKTGVAVFDLQRKLPKARVVYCSATGVTNPGDMAYMTRLGLWGVGTSFPLGFREFLSTIERGGLGMMELVAMHLKRSGVYHCRALSFAGTDFEIVHNDVSALELDMYDRAAEVWQLLHVELTRAIIEASEDPDKAKNIKSFKTYFWGAHQRFFRSLCISLKVSRAIDIVNKEIANGNSVIIGLQGTGEASMNETVKISNSGELDDFISAPKRTLANTIEKLFALLGVEAAAPHKNSQKKQEKKFKNNMNCLDCSSDEFSSDGMSDFVADSDESEESCPSDDSDEVVYLDTIVKNPDAPARGRLTRSSANSSNTRASRDKPRPRGVLYSLSHSEDDGVGASWDDADEEDNKPSGDGDTGSDGVQESDDARGSDDVNLLHPFDDTKAKKPSPMSARLVRGMREEGWRFGGDAGADSWVSRRCRMFYDRESVDGDVVACLPAADNDGVPLWHVKHEDGDSEDLDLEEVKKYTKYFERKQVTKPDDDADGGGESGSDDDASTQTEDSFASAPYRDSCSVGLGRGELRSPDVAESESDQVCLDTAEQHGLASAGEASSAPVLSHSSSSRSAASLTVVSDKSKAVGLDAKTKAAMAAIGWIFFDNPALDPCLKMKIFRQCAEKDPIACLPANVTHGPTMWVLGEGGADKSDFSELSAALSQYYIAQGVDCGVHASAQSHVDSDTMLVDSDTGTVAVAVADNTPVVPQDSLDVDADAMSQGDEDKVLAVPQPLGSRKRCFVVDIDSSDESTVSVQKTEISSGTGGGSGAKRSRKGESDHKGGLSATGRSDAAGAAAVASAERELREATQHNEICAG
jgi:hypothetical protein